MQELDTPKQYDDIDGVIRPSQNTMLFGHNPIVEALWRMRKERHLHHALLFEGPRGIGKATLAFQFAWNIIAAPDGEFVTPSAASPAWRQIAQGSHPSIIHLSRRFDAKTERFGTVITVDDIREINRFLSQTSYDGGWRVVIVDTADDMNRAAANGILKTLEEPPEKTVFILISNSSGRLLPTIRSRCQLVKFRPLDYSNMEKALKHVLARQFPTHAELDSIIAESEGSVRKAALLICYGGMEIIRVQREILGQPIFDAVKAQTLAQALSGRESVIQFQQFCENLLNIISARAKQFASTGNSVLSNRYATIWKNVENEILQTESFNLDKRQFVINVLYEIHKVIAQEI
ncbi:DNA polymerase III subunit delta' [uncultured Bartonella sp.]|uniref:DNA polymerase III subunit delta' n=1 Tax=uncultured Bartonella sp. TaxID=104108 RepID=UPI002602BEFE|nr:DNA polymerase III subunit delta' [uncultured Bartonella sp.]